MSATDVEMSPVADFCACEPGFVPAQAYVGAEGLLHCGGCHRPIECDWSYMDEEHPHAATHLYILIPVCAAHDELAEDHYCGPVY